MHDLSCSRPVKLWSSASANKCKARPYPKSWLCLQMAADKRTKEEAGPAEGSPAPDSCPAPEGTSREPDAAEAPMFDENELAEIQKATGTFSVKHLLDAGFDLQDSG